MIKINTGIESSQRKEIANGLSRVLADTYTLYLKTRNYHWNVTGPMFQTLHGMFASEYEDLARAADQVAERIRALGLPAPGTYKQYSRLSEIREEDDVPNAENMIRRLVEGHETTARTARDVFKVAERAGDQATCELLTKRMHVHEKNAWMLRSLVDHESASASTARPRPKSETKVSQANTAAHRRRTPSETQISQSNGAPNRRRTTRRRGGRALP